jgi:hypothetical protein
LIGRQPVSNLRKTPVAARELGITYANLIYLVRAGKVPAPPRDSSGDFLWDDSAIECARHALSIDRRRKVVATA